MNATSEKIIVRNATLDDLDAIVEIYNEAVAEQRTADTAPTTVEARRPWFDHHGPHRHRPVLVAECRTAAPIDDDHVPPIAGWLSISDHRPGRLALRHTAEVSYYVRSTHRRRGVARALMRACLGQAPAHEIKTLFAILLADNTPSITLLEQFGFERWARLPRVAEFPSNDGAPSREVDQVYYGKRVATD